MEEIKIIFNLGSNQISQSIVTSWLIILLLSLASFLLASKLTVLPKSAQIFLEGIISAMRNTIKAVLPDHVDLVFPYISSLWIFIVIANLIGVLPELRSPTADLSVTSALAFVTFLSVHWFGIRCNGLKNYLKHFTKPSLILLPFHLISEISRTLALAVRLFGNVMSLEFAALLILMIAGFFVPIPILILHIIEAIIQAYIFGMLALIYIAGGIQAQELRKLKNKEGEENE